MHTLDPDERGRTVISSRMVNADVDTVFDAYANPEKIIRWWGPSGFSLINESIDLREGGHWHFVLRAPDGTAFQNHQVFKKIRRPDLFVVSHVSYPKYTGAVAFESLKNKTRVTMYWTFESAEDFAKMKDSVTAGNEGNLDRLEELLVQRAPDNPWKTVRSRAVYQSPWFNVYEDDVITPGGKPGKYAYPQSPPFVLVVGCEDEHFIMIRQYRYPLKRVMTEFPGGRIDKGESPVEAAKREFEEETGLAAEQWKELGALFDPNHATVFLAEGLTATRHNKMAEEGITEVMRATWADIDRMIAGNEFTDSKTLACLTLFERYRRTKTKGLA